MLQFVWKTDLLEGQESAYIPSSDAVNFKLEAYNLWILAESVSTSLMANKGSVHIA